METAIDRSQLSRVVAIINGKGGVLKTTLTSNVAGLLAMSGYRVLAVDLDPQGNLAEDFGYTYGDVDDGGSALAQALTYGGDVRPVIAIRENLDVFVGGPELEIAAAGLEARGPLRAKEALARVLAPMASNYDVILIDCPPGDKTLQTAAMGAAKWALVPVKTDQSSFKGLQAVAERMRNILDTNETLALVGVVMVGVGTSATAVQRDARAEIAGLFGSDSSIVFNATVRHSEATAQAARRRGMLVHELDEAKASDPKWYEIRAGKAQGGLLTPRSTTSVADDLQAVAQELIGRITDAEGKK